MDFIWNIAKGIFGFIFSSIFNFITLIGGHILTLSKEQVVGIALILMISWFIYLIKNYEMEPSVKFGNMAGTIFGFLGVVGSYNG